MVVLRATRRTAIDLGPADRNRVHDIAGDGGGVVGAEDGEGLTGVAGDGGGVIVARAGLAITVSSIWRPTASPTVRAP